jgi:hypothetical protein
MIGDAPTKMRQTSKKTRRLEQYLIVFYNHKKSPKTYSNTANNFSPDVREQLFVANDKNRMGLASIWLNITARIA